MHIMQVVGGRRLKEVRAPDEDWTGRASAKERRRLQNRLHQRAWRRRQTEQANTQNTTPLEPNPVIDLAFAHATAALIPIPPPQKRTTTPLTMHHLLFQTNPPLLPPSHRPHPPPSPHQKTPFFTLYFTLHPPLSPDHYLLTLIQYNVLRGILTNLALCQLLPTLSSACVKTALIPLLPVPAMLPASFAPTLLQRMVQHDLAIDCIPCARMRDNLILGRGRYDVEELCEDVCGGAYQGVDECAGRGLLVWSDPWEVGSWEVSEGFARKWGWVLEGCREMIASTNRWREMRGEEPLVVEVY